MLLFENIGDAKKQLVGVVLRVIDEPDRQALERSGTCRVRDASRIHFGGWI
jgi:hypothetical protein